MSSYLMRYKGTYRLLPEVDRQTNDFVRENDGSICDSDMYIACRNDIRVYAYGHEPDNKITYWLTAYIPSIKKGKMVLRELANRNIEVRHVMETDSEIMFNFKAKDLGKFMEKVHPITLGKDINPHSTKNLPKSNYQIPKESIEDYRAAIDHIPKDGLILIKRITDKFLSKQVQRFLNKKGDRVTVSEDMRKRGMSRMRKEYIHAIGLWDEYIKYLKKEIKNELQ